MDKLARHQFVRHSIEGGYHCGRLYAAISIAWMSLLAHLLPVTKCSCSMEITSDSDSTQVSAPQYAF